MTNKYTYPVVCAVLALALAGMACQALQAPTVTSTPEPATALPAVTQAVAPSVDEPTMQAPNITSNEPYEITGTFTYTNDIITTYYVEQAVALADMYGFVKRDKKWVMPVSSQTLGFMTIDPDKKTGQYTLQLPEVPLGQQVDVDNNGKTDAGVQVFAVSWWPNLTGGPFAEGDDKSLGWPSYLASVRTDPKRKTKSSAAAWWSGRRTINNSSPPALAPMASCSLPMIPSLPFLRGIPSSIWIPSPLA